MVLQVSKFFNILQAQQMTSNVVLKDCWMQEEGTKFSVFKSLIVIVQKVATFWMVMFLYSVNNIQHNIE